MPDIPKWAEIAGDLRALAAEIGTGGRMPSETELAKRYGVNRQTIRQAYRALEVEGLITRHRGGESRQGTTVRDTRPIILRISRHAAAAHGARAGGPWSVAVERAGMRPEVRLTDVTTVELPEVPADIVEALHLIGSAVRRSRVMAADGQPAQITTSWMPLALVIGTALADGDFIPQGVYQAFVDAGLRPDRAVETVQARQATPDEAEALNLPAGVSVLAVTRVTWGEGDGRPLEVLQAVSDATRIRLQYQLDL